MRKKQGAINNTVIGKEKRKKKKGGVGGDTRRERIIKLLLRRPILGTRGQTRMATKSRERQKGGEETGEGF